MIKEDKEDHVYRPAEIAAALRISTVTVSRAIRQGKLKALRVGGQWRVLGSELRRYLDQETSVALDKRRAKRAKESVS
jgi:excisionase family DNA binding protein